MTFALCSMLKVVIDSKLLVFCTSVAIVKRTDILKRAQGYVQEEKAFSFVNTFKARVNETLSELKLVCNFKPRWKVVLFTW